MSELFKPFILALNPHFPKVGSKMSSELFLGRKISWVLLILIHEVTSECPKSPSPLGSYGFVSKSEAECALQCKAWYDCNAYQFMDFGQFQSSSHSLESNCVLQTAWDLDFIAHEMIDAHRNGLNQPKVTC